jgi:hypothetical protein
LVIVIGPFVPELGVHVLEDVPLMPFFDELGVHVPEGPPSMPFFGLGSFCFALPPPGL